MCTHAKLNCLQENSHTQPFLIKWEVYFSKDCVASLYCVVMILRAYVDVCVLLCWVYNTVSRTFLSILVWHYEGRCQADDLFVCFGAKPNKGLSLRSRRDRKWARERHSEELEKGTQRRQLAKGDAKGQWTTFSRRKQWEKASQDEFAFLVALWKFR